MLIWRHNLTMLVLSLLINGLENILFSTQHFIGSLLPYSTRLENLIEKWCSRLSRGKLSNTIHTSIMISGFDTRWSPNPRRSECHATMNVLLLSCVSQRIMACQYMSCTASPMTHHSVSVQIQWIQNSVKRCELCNRSSSGFWMRRVVLKSLGTKRSRVLRFWLVYWPQNITNGFNENFTQAYSISFRL